MNWKCWFPDVGLQTPEEKWNVREIRNLYMKGASWITMYQPEPCMKYTVYVWRNAFNLNSNYIFLVIFIYLVTLLSAPDNLDASEVKSEFDVLEYEDDKLEEFEALLQFPKS